MSDYCRDYEGGDLWEKSLINITILCEGHAEYEDLNDKGFRIAHIPFRPGFTVERIRTVKK